MQSEWRYVCPRLVRKSCKQAGGWPPRIFRSERPPSQNPPLRPIRPPCPAPVAPTPIRSRRRSPITPRQAFLLETTSEGVSAGVEAVLHTRRLVVTAEFLGGDA